MILTLTGQGLVAKSYLSGDTMKTKKVMFRGRVSWIICGVAEVGGKLGLI